VPLLDLDKPERSEGGGSPSNHMESPGHDTRCDPVAACPTRGNLSPHIRPAVGSCLGRAAWDNSGYSFFSEEILP
jgi:hypothetical protein